MVQRERADRPGTAWSTTGSPPACQNNGATTWTYNQGVILGGLAALFEITGDRGYLTQGEAIASRARSARLAPAAASWPNPANRRAGCNEDQAQFKGIFVRYLYDFWLHSRQPAYRAFILANATFAVGLTARTRPASSGCAGPARSTRPMPPGRARPWTPSSPPPP